MKSSFVCLIFTFLVVLIGADKNEDITVINAPSGPIKGLKLNYQKTGEPLYEFRGIPFAKPPIGPLRFKKTEPLEKRKEVHDGTKFGKICMQPGIDFIPELSRPAMSEDCLVLNVYVPRKLHERLSVMVWIHGGGFWIGYGHQYDGGKLAMEGNVIIVTINYRLGAFGFFAVGDSAARGNYGLWDQKMALQWVHDNIASIGGNPESVTVFGESAGGCSASFQSLIPSNKGLFQRVIAQSGVVSRFVVLKDSSVEKFAAEIAEKSSCPFDEKQIFVDCLIEKTADEILKLTDVFASMPTDKMMLESLGMPVVDHELFLEHPIKSLEDKSSDVSQFFRSLDFMAGATSNEGSTLYMMVPPKFQENYEFNVTEGIPLKAVCDGILSPFVELLYANNSKVKDKLCKYYSAESVVDQSLKATDAWADITFNFGINKMLEYHSGGNTYQYVVSKLSPKPFGGHPPSWFKGVGHGDELLYFFNITQFLSLDKEEILNDKDEDFGKKMLSYWTSFAKTGVPYAGDGSVLWKPFDIEDKNYLDLDVEITQKSNYKPEILDLWSNQLPSSDLEPATSDNSQRDEL
ncbi:acylcarnitine hydrolase-like [Mytilus californianus]|uniref:acylcarnitine hydrolase-like n=1 Tax=Mytilus californianus TaxID=6549 RepID=UPI002246935C|nr:acylcarnitine hydrolase-like [Mytilus californianus]XP_052059754.1 acylcarnitine hydrolase-like [Mytilus californianus]XP_052059755.1 acylcarnitine hydrolase-like [Mytilus californianus]